MARAKVFVDTSVLISALLSPKGGSFYVMNQLQNQVHLQISEYVLREVLDVLSRKFSRQFGLRTDLFLLLGIAQVEVLLDPTMSKVRQAGRFVETTDAPILASALEASDYLVTLDKGFFAAEATLFAANFGLKIVSPKGLIAVIEKR